MSEHGSDRLPWMLLAIMVGCMVAAWAIAVQQAGEAKEAKVEADAAWDSANVLLDDLVERSERIAFAVDSMNTYWRGVVDSVSALPPEIRPTSPRLIAVLDTAAVTAELRAAIDTIMAENVALRAQNDTLRITVTNMRVVSMQMADSINAFWQGQRAMDLEVIDGLRRAVEASREEADKWEAAYYASRMSWIDRLVWGVGGAAVGYLGSELTSGGSR